MKLRVVVELDRETNSYSAACPEPPGCASCGDTEEEALENIREAMELYLEPDTRAISPTARVPEVAL